MNNATQSEPGAGSAVVCSWCGAEGQTPGEPCRECQRVNANIPRWAQPRRRGRLAWFTRRRIIRLTIAAVVLVFLAWLYYPFFPNPVTLLFRAPSTEASSDSRDGQWSMTGRDLRLTRHIPVPASQPEGRVVWSRHLGTPTRGAPVVHDGVVYMGGYFEVIALDAATGEELWRLEIATPLDHSVAIAGETLYIGLTNHRVLAVDRNSRQQLWEFKTEGPISSSPVVAGGIVYVGSSDSFVYALDAASGKLLWKAEIVGELRSAPAVSDGLVYAAANLGDLYVFDARTGQDKLRYRASGNTKASPAVGNGLAYFPAGGRVYAVKADAREVAGEYQFNRVWAQFYYWQIPGVPRPPVQKGGQWLFDPDFNAQERTTTGLVAAPAVTPDTLYVGSFRGVFYAADAASGKETWRITADGPVFESAVVMGDRVYFGDSAGSFHALRRSDGEQVWKLALVAPIEIAPVFAEGRFYVRTTDGTLHAIE